jgi:UDP-2,3-diacylglucosamine pyrophosphatase LpxH
MGENPPHSSWQGRPARTHYVILSDLHINIGIPQPMGRWPLVEDFFFDAEFESLLRKLRTEAQGDGSPSFRWTLIINGDFAEFLQILDWPGDPVSRRGGKIEWNLENYEFGPGGWAEAPWKTVPGFQKEIRDGLASGEDESAWKLKRVYDGHRVVFKAIADFVAAGHSVVMIKGNHDVEFYWPGVKEQFIRLLCHSIDYPYTKCQAQLGEWRNQDFRGACQIFANGGTIEFAELSYEDELVYVEHGNQYEPANSFAHFDEPINRVLRAGQTYLEMPFGSILVRYFLNGIESHFQDADNIKPTATAIKRIFKRSYFHALRVLIPNLGRFLDALTFPPAWINLWKILNPAYFTYAIVLVGLLVIYPFSRALAFFSSQTCADPVAWWQFIKEIYGFWTTIGGLAAILLTFFGSFILSDEPLYLRKAACDVWKQLTKGQRFIIFGHTHDPDYWQLGDTNVWYFNTGTWTKVFSEAEALTRPERQLAYLKVVDGKAELLEWVPELANPEQPLRLEEDAAPIRKASSAYLREAGIPQNGLSPFAETGQRIKRIASNVKRFIETVVGLPAKVLWPAFCFSLRVLRVPYRLPKHILRRRDIGREVSRDVKAIGYWLEASWKSLRNGWHQS